MNGFFDSKGIAPAYVGGLLHSCSRCGLYRHVLNPRIEAYGKGEKGILVIGEAPGEWEDKKGKPWQGKVGRKLRRKLESLGIDLFRDCVSINSVNCRPPRNRTPRPNEIDCCRPRVWKVIQEMQPRLILLAGNAAIQSFLGHRWKKDLGGITKWRGWTIPDRDVKAWVCPVFHPSYVGRSDNRGSPHETIWTQDLERALGCLGQDLPYFKDEESCVEILLESDRIRAFLKQLAQDAEELPVHAPTPLVAFDYETTGLKPHSEGHEVVCVSMSPSPDEAVAFPVTRGIKGIFRRLFLDNPTIGKMAHNMKFEDTWSRFFFNTHVQGWKWDSMLAAHILDNRDGVTGLKFQSYVHFGLVDYDSGIAPFLKSNSKSANAMNRVKEAPLGDLLTYCAMDSLLEHRLALLQMEKILK